MPCRSYGLALLALVALPGCAQFNTPSIDGIIQGGEFGNQTNGYNQQTAATSQIWYMTWDAANLYVGITNATLSEGAVIYIDPNPLAPPNSGTNANGNLTGFNYDGAEYATLPFRARFVTYFKDGYNEYRNADGNGNWSNAISNYGAYASNASGNVRELAIPWSAVTGGGLPSSFLFFGYLSSASGYVYGQLPNENPAGQIGTAATATNYYAINTTGNGTSTPPFSIDMSNPNGINTSALYHNTFDPYYRSLEGSVPEGTSMTLVFRTAHYGADSVNLRVYLYDPSTNTTTGPTDYPMSFYQTINQNGTYYDTWTITQMMPSTPSIFYYKFWMVLNGTTEWYSDDYIDDYDNLNKDGTGAPATTEPFDSFQVTVYDPNFQTPSWLQNANVYQIFPDRFRQGNPLDQYCVPNSTAGCPSFYGAPPSSNIAVTPWNSQLCDPRNSSLPCYNNFGSIFYGGDLLGIQNELDYIQGLGFDTIYMTPIFSGNSNHRYDTDDFLNIDPGVGGNTALASLTQQMQQRGMSLIVDGTFEDASSDSTYFNEYNKFATVGACQSLSSQWRSWFQFLDSNVPCTTTDYTGWSGFNTLPLLDTSQAAVQQFFFSGTPDNVLLHWYNAGASGWRFDSAPNIPHTYWHALRPYAKTYNNQGPLIGEIWPNASQWLCGDQMDSTMNYRFRRNLTGFVRWPYNWADDNDNGNDAIIPLKPSQFDTANRAIRDDYPLQATQALLNLIDSHDTNRALYVMTELGDNGLVQAKQRLELAALFQFTYMGAPMVFYGDEVAINAPSLQTGPNGPISDPYMRAPYPWTDQAGSSNVYGPPDQNVLAFYTLLGHLRKQHISLRNGTFTTLLTGDTQQPATAPNTYAYARQSGSETAIVALNNGSTTNTPTIAVGAYYADGTQLQDVISGSTFTVSGGSISLTLPAITGMVLFPAPATVDLTPPAGAITLTPPPNNGGWLNTSPIMANLSATDSDNTISQIRYWVDNAAVASAASSRATAMVSGEGMHTVGMRAIDNAGNISALVNQAANIDLTPPVVMVTGVSQGASYSYGSVPAAGCNTTDALSGVATPATVQISGGNGQGTGTFTATCSGASDVAGNAAAPVSVSYMVSGNPPTPTSTTLTAAPNPARLGQAVTLTAQIAPAPNSGKVTFYDGTMMVGIAPVSGASARLTTNLLFSGSHNLRAFYEGTSSFSCSSSASTALTVQAIGASTFQAPVTYALPAMGVAVVTGDFNGDGKSDFAVATSSAVSVFLGQGGSFGAAINSPAGQGPLALAASDFNGDGIPDLAVVNMNAGVSVLLGKGDGTFQTPVSYGAGQAPVAIAVADVNGDGFADLVVANGMPGISVLLGNGNGTFRSPPSINDVNSPLAISVGDFNADGKPDVAVGNGNGTVGVLLGNGDGTFQAPVNYSVGGSAWSVAVADLNGDGKADLAVANNFGGYLSVLLGNGDGTFQTAVSYATDAGPQSIAAADVNGDGVPDLVVAAASGAIDVLLGNGNGSFQPPVAFPMANPVSVALANFNGDGRTDVVAVSGSGNLAAVLLGAQASSSISLISSQNPSLEGQSVTFTAGVTAAAPYFGRPSGSVTFSDNGSTLPAGTVTLNGGSAAYMSSSLAIGMHPITAAYSGDSFFLGGSSMIVTQTVNLIPQTISFPALPNQTYGSPPFTVNATASSGLTVSYTASGPCTVSGNTVSLTGAGTCSITANQPGNAMYAPASSVTNNFTIVKEMVSLSLSVPATMQQGQNVTMTATLSLAAPSGSFVVFYDSSVILGYGVFSGSTAMFETTLLASGPHWLHAYFPGNGNIASANSTVQLLTISAVPAGTLSPPASYSVGNNPAMLAVADFNGDGLPDLAVANNDTSAGTNASVSILLNSGHGAFTSAANYIADSGTTGVVAADFNGDGFSDLALISPVTQRVTIMQGGGNGAFTPLPQHFTAGTLPMRAAVADLNNDGISDLVVVNSGSSNVSVLLGNGQFKFKSAANYAVGTSPYGVVIGDFNGDGIADIGVSNQGSNNVTVLLGNGDGTFHTGVNYAVGTAPAILVAADFNADGKMDLAVANSGSNNISVLLGNGDGTFQTAVNYVTDAGPQSIATADINGDGILDLVVAASSGAIDVLLGNGNGSFQAPVRFPMVSSVAVALADFNGDGRTDVAAVSASGNLAGVMLGAQALTSTSLISSQNPSIAGQSVTFTAGVTAAAPYFATPSGSVTFSDNGAALTGGTVALTAGSAAYMTSSLAGGMHPITAGYSGDSRFLASTSMVVTQTVNLIPQTITFPAIPNQTYGTPPFPVNATASSGLTVSYTASGPCTITGNTVTLTGVGTCTITANQPGNTMYAPAPSVSNNFTIGKETVSLTLTAPASMQQGQSVTMTATLSAPPGSASVVFYDSSVILGYVAFSGNTATLKTTLLSPGPHSLRAYFPGTANINSANSAVQLLTISAVAVGTLSPPSTYSVGSNPAMVAVADFNGDGRPDLAVVNNDTAAMSASVSVLLNNGHGAFGSAANYIADSGTTGVVVSDFNRDGFPDVALISPVTQRITILQGGANGSFTSLGQHFTAGTSPVRAAVADLNNDGVPDLVVVNNGSNNVSVLLGNGKFSFKHAVNYAVGTAPYGVVIGDFNGDGIADVAVSNQGSNNITVMLGNGDGTLGTGVNYAAGTAPAILVAADFNADGKMDLAVANSGSNNISVLLGNGDGTFQTAVTFATDAIPQSIATADVNGDGIPDLVVAAGSGATDVLLGNGNGSFQAPVSFPMANPVAVALADFNGDGRTDVVAVSGSGNVAAVMLGVKAPTSISLMSSQNPSMAGQPVTFTAAVTAVGPNFATPSGSVTFADNGTALPGGTVTLNAGSAAYMTSTLAGGMNPITAGYSGDSRFLAMTSTVLTQTVNLIPQTITFPAIPNQTYGAPPFNLNATASSGLTVSYTASGPCTVSGNTVSLTGAGTCTITANQPGNAIYSPAPSVNNSFTIAKETVSLSLSVPASMQQGQSVTMTATLSAAAPIGSSAVFYDSSVIIGYGTFAGGTAIFKTTLLTPGAHSLHAYYPGNANIGSANSAVQGLSISAAPAGTLSRTSYSVGNNPAMVAVADFNGDGLPDLAVADNDTTIGVTASVSILINSGHGAFASAANYAADSGTTGVVAADFNRDGFPDLALISPVTQRITLLQGDGNGAFTPLSQHFTAGTSPMRAAVADLNNDGVSDLVVVNNGSNNVSVLLGTGQFNFKSAVNYAVGTSPYGVVIGDFNGDGIADIAVSNKGSNNITILLGNGDGTFRAGVNYAVGTAPAILLAADFNADGKMDLAVANSGSNNVSVLLGNGDGTFQAAVNYAVGTSPIGITTTDLDGDGKLDLIAANSASSNMTVLRGSGNGNFINVASFPTGTMPGGLVASDFNQDGRSDIAVTNGGTASVSILRGSVATAATKLTSAPNPSASGQTVNFTATITVPSGPFFALPSGSMIFADGGVTIGTVAVAGTTVRFATSSLTTGTHSITAAYSGNSAFTASTSPPVSQVVQ